MDGWLEVNKDPFPDDLLKVLESTTDKFFHSLFVQTKVALTRGQSLIQRQASLNKLVRATHEALNEGSRLITAVCRADSKVKRRRRPAAWQVLGVNTRHS